MKSRTIKRKTTKTPWREVNIPGFQRAGKSSNPLLNSHSAKLLRFLFQRSFRLILYNTRCPETPLMKRVLNNFAVTFKNFLLHTLAIKLRHSNTKRMVTKTPEEGSTTGLTWLYSKRCSYWVRSIF